jgi:adenosylcobinamide-GDP ribazoletransferase
MPGGSALAAVSFLTRVPVRRTIAARDVARGVVFFPVVGAAIGAVTGGVALLAHLALSPLLSAALAVAAATALTGGLHLDALADTADGVGARDDPLAAMRDSRLGSFGVAALALDLVIKVAAIAQLVSSRHVLVTLVAAGALSRAASVGLSGVLPYVRESGAGDVLAGAWTWAAVVVGCALAAIAGIDGAVLASCVLAATVALGFAYRRWLGGVTGDLLGTVVELTETLALVAAAALA